MVSCNQPTEQNTNVDSLSARRDSLHADVFKKKDLNTDNLLFLDFWFKMSSFEYKTIADTLLKQRILTTDTNGIAFTLRFSRVEMFLDQPKSVSMQCRLKINPLFQNDSLIRISLYSQEESCLENIKELYKEKYGRPNRTTSIGRYRAREPKQYPNDIRKNIEEAFDSKYYDNYLKEINYNWQTGNNMIDLVEEYTTERPIYRRGSIEDVVFKSLLIRYQNRVYYENTTRESRIENENKFQLLEKAAERKKEENLDRI